MSKEADSGQNAPRDRRLPKYLQEDFETDNEIIDAACKPDNKQKGGPGRELFKDDIYECIHMIFNGSTTEDVTNYIQQDIIGAGKKIRTVLNKMDNPDRECLAAKTRAKQGKNTTDANIKNYKGRGDRTTKDTLDKEEISENRNMRKALDEFPIIKKYTGTERTTFIRKHYEDRREDIPMSEDGEAINKPAIKQMLIDEYSAHEDNIIPDNDNEYGIKSFELNVDPIHYGYCGQCWLCSQPVYYYHGALETTSCGDCEHVAGIVVGMLTGLLAFQGQDLMVYAYQPSHVHCNRFKNDDITIMFDAENGRWTPDKDSIKKIVEYIANDDAVYSSEYCPMLKARFNNAIKPGKGRTIYDRFENERHYIEKVVTDYKDKCRKSILMHSTLLCNKINYYYSLPANTESQQMSDWVNTIASFFKEKPSLGKTSGGMDVEGDDKDKDEKKVHHHKQAMIRVLLLPQLQ